MQLTQRLLVLGILAIIAATGCGSTGSKKENPAQIKASDGCVASTAAEMDVKKYLAKMHRSEYWGKCVKISGHYGGTASLREGVLMFTLTADGTDSFSIRAPMSKQEFLFSLISGEPITVAGRPQNTGTSGDSVADWILAEDVIRGR